MLTNLIYISIAAILIFVLYLAVKAITRGVEAKSDLKRAVKLNPEDKAIKKLTAKIDLVIKKQKAKEKKMAKRMFG